MLYLLCSDFAVVCRSILTMIVRLDKAYSTTEQMSETRRPLVSSGHLVVCAKVKSFID